MHGFSQNTTVLINLKGQRSSECAGNILDPAVLFTFNAYIFESSRLEFNHELFYAPGYNLKHAPTTLRNQKLYPAHCLEGTTGKKIPRCLTSALCRVIALMHDVFIFNHSLLLDGMADFGIMRSRPHHLRLANTESIGSPSGKL